MSEDDIFDVGRKTIYWMIAGFVMAMVMIAYVMIIGGYKARLMEMPKEIKSEFVTLRFVNNPDCFAYQDAVTKRVFPFSIDLTKFKEEKRMDKCYLTEKEKGYKTFNFKLLLGQYGSVETNNYFEVPQSQKEYGVLVWDGSKFERETLLIEVQETLPYLPTEEQKKTASPPTQASGSTPSIPASAATDSD